MDPQALIGGTAYGPDGDRIGSIGRVYLDASGEPTWLTVHTGLFGTHESFVPLDGAELLDDGVRVPYAKDVVKDAPRVEADRDLSEQEEDQLYAHYGLPTSGSGTVPAGWGNATAVDADGVDDDAADPIRYAGFDAGNYPGSNPTLETSDYVEPEPATARPGRLRRFLAD